MGLINKLITGGPHIVGNHGFSQQFLWFPVNLPSSTSGIWMVSRSAVGFCLEIYMGKHLGDMFQETRSTSPATGWVGNTIVDPAFEDLYGRIFVHYIYI